MVFQSYALYPHMTAGENIGFGMRIAKRPKAEIKQKVHEAAQILKIEDLLSRKPRALSGGQRQRVAIGQAIVREPKLFLFNEPLSNLDAALRVEMRVELARLQNQIGTTMIYVTHDQVEAMTLADRIVVMNNGVVEQLGDSTLLYTRLPDGQAATVQLPGQIPAKAGEAIPLRINCKSPMLFCGGAQNIYV